MKVSKPHVTYKGIREEGWGNAAMAFRHATKVYHTVTGDPYAQLSKDAVTGAGDPESALFVLAFALDVRSTEYSVHIFAPDAGAPSGTATWKAREIYSYDLSDETCKTSQETIGARYVSCLVSGSEPSQCILFRARF